MFTKEDESFIRFVRELRPTCTKSGVEYFTRKLKGFEKELSRIARKGCDEPLTSYELKRERELQEEVVFLCQMLGFPVDLDSDPRGCAFFVKLPEVGGFFRSNDIGQRGWCFPEG